MNDRLYQIESVIYALGDAIDALRELGNDAGCDIACIEDMRSQYRREAQQLHSRIEARDARDEAALTREYYRGR